MLQSVSRYDQDSSSMLNNLVNQFFMYCDALDGIMEDSFGADEDKDEPCSLSMSKVSWSTPVVGLAPVRPAVQVRDRSR